MPLTEFELEVLGQVTDDYEAIHTIRGDIARKLARPIPDEEVAAALDSLLRQGLVDSFSVDPSSSQYHRVKAGSVPVNELW